MSAYGSPSGVCVCVCVCGSVGRQGAAIYAAPSRAMQKHAGTEETIRTLAKHTQNAAAKCQRQSPLTSHPATAIGRSHSLLECIFITF